MTYIFVKLYHACSLRALNSREWKLTVKSMLEDLGQQAPMMMVIYHQTKHFSVCFWFNFLLAF